MRTVLWSLALFFGILLMWGAFIWLFGDIGLLLIVISGFTMPIWLSIIAETIFGPD